MSNFEIKTPLLVEVIAKGSTGHFSKLIAMTSAIRNVSTVTFETVNKFTEFSKTFEVMP